MATEYPNSKDVFSEPLSPQTTFLAQEGPDGRNHYEHHRDLGDAVEALQEHAAKRGHDHSGSATDTSRGIKLLQANTHQSADTDLSASSLHHTLGTGAGQAAAGNHTHDYALSPGQGGTILNRPFVVCTSTTRPGSPFAGLTIFETDTRRFWVYHTGRWNISHGGSVPVVRLAQSAIQPVYPNGTVIEWNEEIEDSFGYVTPVSGKATEITVSEPGLYQVSVGIQWGVSFIPETVTAVLCVDGQETALRNSSMQIRSGLLALVGVNVPADFSQTLSVAGSLRLAAGEVVTLKARYGGSQAPLQGFVNTFFDLPSGAKSRLEMIYIGP